MIHPKDINQNNHFNSDDYFTLYIEGDDALYDFEICNETNSGLLVGYRRDNRAFYIPYKTRTYFVRVRYNKKYFSKSLKIGREVNYQEIYFRAGTPKWIGHMFNYVGSYYVAGIIPIIITGIMLPYVFLKNMYFKMSNKVFRDL